MPRLELPQGPVHYGDTGGAGPVVLLVHGLLSDGGLWDDVVAGLPGCRCLTPTLPMGSHTEPMRDGADLSPRGVARIIDGFLAALGLDGVTIVACDSGGAVTQLLVTERPERIGRLVLTPCDAFGNFFPPLFMPYVWIARAPRLLGAVLQTMRIRALRGLPFAFGRIAKRGVPHATTDRWLAPALTNAGVRRDAAKFLRGVDRRDTLRAAELLPGFGKPALLLWPREERTFPFAHAERLRDLLPDSRLVEVPDAWAFLALDQPARTAEAIGAFVQAGSADRGMAPSGT